MSRPRSERPAALRAASYLAAMVAVAAVLGVVVAGLALPFVGVVGFTADSAAETLDQLPTELEADALPQKTRILDGDGDVLATIYDENRVNVEITQVSRVMLKAIVAIEDYRFFEHGALDVKGTLRALITNQANSGVVQGGSTITQQMVKLTLLQQADTRAEMKAATEQTIRPQAARAEVCDRGRGALRQAVDPRALPQHRLLRRRRLRRAGRGPALLQRQCP